MAALQTFRVQADQLTANNRFPDETTKKMVTEMVGQIFDSIASTLATGKIDAVRDRELVG